MTRLARDYALTDNQTGKVDPAYMAEVDAHTNRRVAAFAKAQRALEAAVRRHEKAVAKAASQQAKRADIVRMMRAWELVEERLRELRVLEALMTEVPASREHRGTGQAKHRS